MEIIGTVNLRLPLPIIHILLVDLVTVDSLMSGKTKVTSYEEIVAFLAPYENLDDHQELVNVFNKILAMNAKIDENVPL